MEDTKTINKEREMNELESLRDSVVSLDFEGAKKAAQEAMNKGLSPGNAIKSLHAGMRIVAEKFVGRESVLTDLVVAGAVAQETLEIIKPYIERKEQEHRGKVVLATVQGDIHDIGKNIVGLMLTAAGCEVIDLGVDVTDEEIRYTVREHKPHILGLSTSLTMTMMEMEVVIKTLEKANLRTGLKVIVGGAPVTDEFAKTIGADYNAQDAVDGVNKCREWLAKRRQTRAYEVLNPSLV